MQIILYSRQGCHLCTEAKEVLKDLQRDFSLEIIERNIDESEEWIEKYGLMIPVVESENETLQYGQIDYFSLRKRLQWKS
ncbi:glutaredoxin family protein [Heyndrickxia acidicola]|uniref:Glutaredoxin family protein n=1 Tax=Heyndrickxia acidicola TaxID=209389 RepID=A0ABU6MGH8_9BACI|nr:glutaredoxin family protein [Heyndrickxia acidicola]MED1203783.1 glutaredoxin family protein [Heyndrickxia acidicola]